MGGQFCCFPSQGYIIGANPASGPSPNGAGAGYGYGSRSVPVPIPASSQVLIASHQIAMVSSQQPAPPIPITNVPSTNVYVPTYGQSSIMHPYNVSVVQPVAGSIMAPVQPYGVSSFGQN